MILKVRIDDKDTVDAWRFFGNVEEFFFNLYKKPEDMKSIIGCSGDVRVEHYEMDQRPDCSFVFMMFCSYGKTFHVYCNTECYLLNDDGRTIERIY